MFTDHRYHYHKASAYTVPELPLPLRPLWITPATSVFPQLPAPEHARYLPIICVSASKQAHDGVERRLNGFSYVQGSGDDHELWGMVRLPSHDFSMAALRSYRFRV